MTEQRPNVLFLMSDEHRSDVAGWAGDPVARTPNLDRLAEGAVVFSNCHTPAPVCVPARQCMLSGQYPKTCGCEGWDSLPPGHMTFGRRFTQYAYETVACGNMHLLGTDQMAGFTVRIGENCIVSSRYSGVLDQELGRYPPPEAGTGKWSMAREIQRAGIGDGRRTIRDGYALLGAMNHVHQYFVDPYYDRPTPQRPLLLMLSLIQPHYPFMADAERFGYYLNRVRPFLEDREPLHPNLAAQRVRVGTDVTERDVRRATAAYYAMVETADDYFGQLVRAIEATGQDLDDWIVVYCSDHGEMLGQYGLWEKMVLFEASVKVPLFIRWPRRFGGGRVIDQNVSLCDLFATLCELADIPVPGGLDSRSLVPYLCGGTPGHDGEVYSQYTHNQYMIKQDHLKYVRFDPDGTEILFDLRADPAESRSFAAETGYADAMRRFRCRLAELGQGPDADPGYVNAGYG